MTDPVCASHADVDIGLVEMPGPVPGQPAMRCACLNKACASHIAAQASRIAEQACVIKHLVGIVDKMAERMIAAGVEV